MTRTEDIQNLLTQDPSARPRIIAELVHAKQLDAGGQPYIGHPRRVAENAALFASGKGLNKEVIEKVVAAGWLHDVIEDSPGEPWGPVTKQDLLSWGIEVEVIEIVELLTRDPQDPNSESYYFRIKASPLARIVKIADIADNCNRQRRLLLDPRRVGHYEKKYNHALDLLELTDMEKAFVTSRSQGPCEFHGLDAEQYLNFFTTDLGLHAFGARHLQWHFHLETKSWISTGDVCEHHVLEENFPSFITLEEAKAHAPEAFPMIAHNEHY